jgi:ATP-binding cassette subfamily B protein
LIFDDSLSAVDTETDMRIRRALKKRSKDVTTFIISHRISTLSEADYILVLDGGRLIQSGTHEQLIETDGLYKRIWDLQKMVV